MNKKGWIQIVEAFVAILLVIGAILIILNKGYLEKRDSSEEVYKIQLSILREIQTNKTLRMEVVNAPGPLPIEWENFPEMIKKKIIERTPNYLECIGKICEMTEECGLTEKKEKDVYAQPVAISALVETEQGIDEVYRQLNLFCWNE